MNPGDPARRIYVPIASGSNRSLCLGHLLRRARIRRCGHPAWAPPPEPERVARVPEERGDAPPEEPEEHRGDPLPPRGPVGAAGSLVPVCRSTWRHDLGEPTDQAVGGPRRVWASAPVGLGQQPSARAGADRGQVAVEDEPPAALEKDDVARPQAGRPATGHAHFRPRGHRRSQALARDRDADPLVEHGLHPGAQESRSVHGPDHPAAPRAPARAAAEMRCH